MKNTLNGFTKRIAITKLCGFLFGGVAFFALPIVFTQSDYTMRFGIWAWYISIGAMIGAFGVMNKIPLLNVNFPYWIRGTFLGGWMNFVLLLFIYDKVVALMQGTMFEGMSPFWLIIEGMIFGFLADLIATHYVGDGKKLLEK